MNIRFDEPEFYEKDAVVLTASGPYGTYHIVSEGERDVLYIRNDGDRFFPSAAHEFRELFPDGNLPEMDDNFVWRYNGWFSIYEDAAEDCEPLGEPLMSLAETVTYALELAYYKE
jgi:hypothetical protein